MKIYFLFCYNPRINEMRFSDEQEKEFKKFVMMFNLGADPTALSEQATLVDNIENTARYHLFKFDTEKELNNFKEGVDFGSDGDVSFYTWKTDSLYNIALELENIAKKLKSNPITPSNRTKLSNKTKKMLQFLIEKI